MCEDESKVLNKELNICEDKVGPMTLAICTQQRKWFNKALGRCDAFIDCDVLQKSANFKWKLDIDRNECQKVKPSFKFRKGLAIMMIVAMIAALLYLVLDDRFFCLRSQRVELSARGVPTHHI